MHSSTKNQHRSNLAWFSLFNHRISLGGEFDPPVFTEIPACLSDHPMLAKACRAAMMASALAFECLLRRSCTLEGTVWRYGCAFHPLFENHFCQRRFSRSVLKPTLSSLRFTSTMFYPQTVVYTKTLFYAKTVCCKKEKESSTSVTNLSGCRLPTHQEKSFLVSKIQMKPRGTKEEQ